MAVRGAHELQPLGVGRILGDTFSQFFSGFVLVMVIIFVPTAILELAQHLVTAGWLADLTSGSTVVGFDGTAGAFSALTGPVLLLVLVYIVVTIVIWGAAMVGIGDRIRGRQRRFVSYYLIPVMKFPQLIILGILMTLVVWVPVILVFLVSSAIGDGVAVIGVLLAMALSLYLMAALSPVFPEILLGTAGWGSLSRALALTRDYRWRIAGVMLLFYLILFLIALVIGLIVGVASFAALTGVSGPVAFADPTAFGPLQIFLQILNAITTAAVTGFFVTFSVVLYYRLVEIKEGPVAADLEQVFE